MIDVRDEQRKKMERAWQDQRLEICEAKRRIDVHLSAAFQHLAEMLPKKSEDVATSSADPVLLSK